MITPTLPGTIPGLLRRGSPVIEDDRIAVYLGADHYGYHYVADLTPKRGCGHRIVQGPVDLDLSDPTGRAHAAWWLVQSHHPQGGTALWRVADAGLKWWRLSWVSTGWGGNDGGLGSEVYAPMDVPSLAALNPDDDTRLPDGSRWVDAEALRLVCLHVAGASGV